MARSNSARQEARARSRAAAERRQAAQRRIRLRAERLMVRIADRDDALERADRRIGQEIVALMEEEGLRVADIIEWCDGSVTAQEITRLRRLTEDTDQGTGDSADAGAGAAVTDAGAQGAVQAGSQKQ